MELTVRNILKEHFPMLMDADLVNDIVAISTYNEFDEGDRLMGIGSIIRSLPMLVSGSVKVMREDEDGNELLLYYIKAGETCAMSLTCCMANKRSEIKAVAQEGGRMLSVPVRYMEEWMIYRDWRNFVMNTYRYRFEELLEVLDSIAFLRMDDRLWRYLNEKSTALDSRELTISHQQIAYDLNSSREVISRLLKQMENLGQLKLGRNRILLLGVNH